MVFSWSALWVSRRGPRPRLFVLEVDPMPIVGDVLLCCGSESARCLPAGGLPEGVGLSVGRLLPMSKKVCGSCRHLYGESERPL